ncbi:MAG: U32 family peptidase, partial [Clostridium sp.]|nr:U32 family peptidase [Clostridium sp.]
MIHKPELLAPAGHPEAFYAAMNAGADAVYVGGKDFSARAGATNFTQDELLHAIEYAHLYQKKVYLTLNTLLKDDEIERLYDTITPLANEGLDAVLVQDIGVLSYLRRTFPHLAIHASTQMMIDSDLSFDLLAKLGVSRVVLARELSLAEIKDIKHCSPDEGIHQRTQSKDRMEIEVFIHGAMCYSYSGACYFSSMLGERSANRGRCAQPCRLPYRVGASGEYLLSMRDLCGIHRLPELILAGVNSFKIEGRMKRSEYVAGVTSIYRKYLDRAYEMILRQKNSEEMKIESSDLEILKSLYLRSKQGEGYFCQRNGEALLTMDSCTYRETPPHILERVRQQISFEPTKLPVCMEMH